MQHNTYDIEFYGPNTMCGSLYLGALRAGEAMARHLGEPDAADRYAALADKGGAWTDEHLFNGEYYEQQVEPDAHKAWPEPQQSAALRHGRDDKFDWPKWQYGKGCLSDQLIGQWCARMLHLGDLYDPKHIRKTLRSVFKHNWKTDLTDHACAWRLFALNEEPALLLCTWPKGERPGYAFFFADEVWCGIEYQVAAHMIREGLTDEGLAIVKGLRDRHRGDKRNPWNEFECGHHYARSMASYDLLHALSGFAYSAPAKSITFAPRVSPKRFRTFFSVGSGWGEIAQRTGKRKTTVELTVHEGALQVGRLCLALSANGADATLAGQSVPADIEKTPDGPCVRFDPPVTIPAGQTLKVRLT
jgi:non-lysosomal glucosylceramidase